MIEIVNLKERNLKDLKQIGTPKEENKIYVEQMVYAKIKEKSYKEKRAFVLMGHTERLEGRYITFIEGVIPIREIEFQGNIPRWNNSTWSEIFREIKRLYEDMIIVGWAIDVKGMMLKITPELERVHREHFGGVHQLLFLLDTLEQEESFYMYKENKVVPKDGFYIYHNARKKESAEISPEKYEPIPIKVLQQGEEDMHRQIDVEVDIHHEQENAKEWKGGRYRELVNMHEKKTSKVMEEGNIGVAIAVAMLIFVVGVGIYEDRGSLFASSDGVPVNIIQEQSGRQNAVESDTEETMDATETENADVSTGADVIPVDVISGLRQTDEEK